MLLQPGMPVNDQTVFPRLIYSLDLTYDGTLFFCDRLEFSFD